MNKKQGDSKTGYRYTYDNLNQLTASTFGTIDYANGTFTDASNGVMSEQFGYDKNGNINYLTRKNSQGNTYLHNYTTDKFTYSGNKLTNLSGYGSYSFNNIGQVTAMTLPNAQASTITYNPYHLTKSITQATGETTNYEYNELGNRIITTDVTDVTTSQTFSVYDATGNLMCVYEKPTSSSAIAATKWIIYGASKIGTVSKSGPTYAYDYELTDHLGTVRATIDASKATGNNANANDQGFEYYAYGLTRSSVASNYPFGYQGQYAQKDEATGLYHFKARDFDPTIPHWNTTDPAGQYYSPYIPMGNNPISGVDPNGRDVIILNRPLSAFLFGHNALLVGDDINGWQYISKEGTKWGIHGDVNNLTREVADLPPFQTVQDFFNSKFSEGFQSGILIETSKTTDSEISYRAKNSSLDDYNLFTANCSQCVTRSLTDTKQISKALRNIPFPNLAYTNIINSLVLTGKQKYSLSYYNSFHLLRPIRNPKITVEPGTYRFLSK